jgi:hypothetical protein
MSFATCRGCERAFAKDGWGAASASSPRLCRDCEARELAFHAHHAPGVVCLAKFMGAAA